MGVLLNGTNLDSVRIEELGMGRAVQIPLSLVIDADTALREVSEIGSALIVYKVSCDLWFAECGGGFYGKGATPFQAIAAMKDTK